MYIYYRQVRVRVRFENIHAFEGLVQFLFAFAHTFGRPAHHWNEFFTSLCVWINSEVRPCTQPRAPCTLVAMSYTSLSVSINSEVCFCTHLHAPCTLFAMSSSRHYVCELIRRSGFVQTSVHSAHYLWGVLLYVHELIRRSGFAQTSVRPAHYLRWVLHFGGPIGLGSL